MMRSLSILLVASAACSAGTPGRDDASQAGTSSTAGTVAGMSPGDASIATQGEDAEGTALGTLDAGMHSQDARTDANASTPPRDPEEVLGFAAVSGDGDATTTGGQAGAVVTAKNADELIAFAASEDPLVIELQGTFSVPRLVVASNKTLRGLDANTTLLGGIRIRGKEDALVHNVIVQNLKVNAATSEVDGDGVQIHYAHHVWVDHCEIWDAPDGNLDVVHASSFVTVSFTKFHYTDAAPDAQHRFSNLIGHTDDNDEDVGRLDVSFHHDYWASGVIERMPRVRYGRVHVWNSYYAASGNNYAVGAGFESKLLIENNVFEGVNDPHLFYDAEPTAQIVAAGNRYPSSSGAQDIGQGSAFVAPYPYDLDPVADVKAFVIANAGPR